MDSQNFGMPILLESQSFWPLKFRFPKFCVPKDSGPHNFGPQKSCVPKILGQKMGPPIFSSQKFGPQKFGPQNFWSRKFRVPKIVSIQKFGPPKMGPQIGPPKMGPGPFWDFFLFIFGGARGTSLDLPWNFKKIGVRQNYTSVDPKYVCEASQGGGHTEKSEAMPKKLKTCQGGREQRKLQVILHIRHLEDLPGRARPM